MTIGFPDPSPSERHGRWDHDCWDDTMRGNPQPPLESAAVRKSWNSLVAQTKIDSFYPSSMSPGDNSKPMNLPDLEKKVHQLKVAKTPWSYKPSRPKIKKSDLQSRRWNYREQNVEISSFLPSQKYTLPAINRTGHLPCPTTHSTQCRA